MASSKNFLANGEKGRIKVVSEVTCEGGGRDVLWSSRQRKMREWKKLNRDTDSLLPDIDRYFCGVHVRLVSDFIQRGFAAFFCKSTMKRILNKLKQRAVMTNVKVWRLNPKFTLQRRFLHFCRRQLLTHVIFDDLYSCQNYQQAH